MIKITYWLSIGIALLLVLLFETDTLMPGVLADDVSVQFVVVTLTELFTICVIPLAVRLLRFNKIRTKIKAGGYCKWAMIRLLMLSLLLNANTILYYIYMNVAFGYMAIIMLISMAFIYPSESRMKREMTIE
ncbi:MAG: hypothetical protein SOZ80_09110 [Prevotella sp.]|uniref:hypothetical protein n=1 Tax=Prevotella sp. TaxID=59823 RepID=UPI002A2D5422|nr:hypothetical protein [Prevotella sp.]MDD7318195.1 hypothetical protein [Prevotellaceae bacterium]MDY4020916.1 hypothetical protein [Prevotella sp.]